MRHIRDPVTGRCVVCDGNHGSLTPGNKVINTHPDAAKPNSWDKAKRKVIYMNAFNPQRSRSPSPTRPRPQPNNYHADRVYASPRPDPFSPRDTPNQRRLKQPQHDRDSPASLDSARSTSRIVLVGGGAPMGPRPRGFSPDRGRSRDRFSERDRPQDKYRERTPSPSGAGCCGGMGRRHGDRPKYGHFKHGEAHGFPAKQRGIGAAYHRSTVYNGHANNWGRRRCCALGMGLLAFFLLAGLAVGLYFALATATSLNAASAPENVYSGGYYVNGVYVVPVTSAPAQSYVVVGADTPCNPYNNNTGTGDPLPNCQDVTTILVPAK